jgi:hypothetical protein
MEAEMPMLKILAVAIGTLLGSLLVAVLVCCLAWWIATRLHHPRWAAIFSLIVIAGAWLAALGNSEFAKMAIVFGIVGSGLLYLAGREEERDGSSHETKIAGSVTMGRNR